MMSCGVTIDSGVGRGFADCLKRIRAVVKSKTAPMPTMEAVNDVKDYIYKGSPLTVRIGARSVRDRDW